MSTYSIRVLLHGGEREHYTALEKHLRAIGALDVIMGDDGRWYQLPPGEYTMPSHLWLEAARSTVYHIAEAISPFPAVYVTQSAGQAWVGLRSVL